MSKFNKFAFLLVLPLTLILSSCGETNRVINKLDPLANKVIEKDSFALGDTFTQDDFTYTILSDNEVSISSYNKQRDTLNIKESVSYKGYNFDIHEIDSKAFEDCDNLVTVEIPSNITYIGIDAFSYCDNLTSVTINSKGCCIDFYAFEGSNKMEKLIANNSMLSPCLPNHLKELYFDYEIFNFNILFSITGDLDKLVISNKIKEIQINDEQAHCKNLYLHNIDAFCNHFDEDAQTLSFENVYIDGSLEEIKAHIGESYSFVDYVSKRSSNIYCKENGIYVKATL